MQSSLKLMRCMIIMRKSLQLLLDNIHTINCNRFVWYLEDNYSFIEMHSLHNYILLGLSSSILPELSFSPPPDFVIPASSWMDR